MYLLFKLDFAYKPVTDKYTDKMMDTDAVWSPTMYAISSKGPDSSTVIHLINKVYPII
jgi:hypothetical protein